MELKYYANSKWVIRRHPNLIVAQRGISLWWQIIRTIGHSGNVNTSFSLQVKWEEFCERLNQFSGRCMENPKHQRQLFVTAERILLNNYSYLKTDLTICYNDTDLVIVLMQAVLWKQKRWWKSCFITRLCFNVADKKRVSLKKSLDFHYDLWAHGKMFLHSK